MPCCRQLFDWVLYLVLADQNTMNFAASLCQRVNLRQLVSTFPAYAAATGMAVLLKMSRV